MVADLRLRCRSEDRFLQTRCLSEPVGQFNIADAAFAAVLLQCRTGEVAAGDALVRHHLQALAQHGPAQHGLRNPRIIRRADDMIGEIDVVEEEVAHRRENAAFIRDRRLQDVVEGGDPVRGHQHERVIVDFIDIANLATSNARVAVQVGALRRGGSDVGFA